MPLAFPKRKQTAEDDMQANVLRLPDVKRMTGLSRSSIYAMIENKAFPRQIVLGRRAVGWLESEIQDWLKARMECRAK